MQNIEFGVGEKPPKLLSKTQYYEQDTIFKAANMQYSDYLEYMTLQWQIENINDSVVWQTGMEEGENESGGEDDEESEPCGACMALSGQVFHIDNIPKKPHKHCKCGTVPLRLHITFAQIDERLERLEELEGKLQKTLDTLKKNAKTKDPKTGKWIMPDGSPAKLGQCGKYVGKVIRTSIPNLGYPESASAKNYGEPLENAGFDAVAEHYNGEGYKNLPDDYTPHAGDVVVFDASKNHPDGHIAMYDGEDWYSDFKQTDMHGGSARDNDPNYTIYRYDKW